MKYHPVTYRKQEGTLVCSPTYLSFYPDESPVSEQWPLESLDKVSANGKGMKRPLLRVNHATKDKKPLFFLFKDRNTLQEARENIKSHVIQARVLQEEDYHMSMSDWNDDSAYHHHLKSSSEMNDSTENHDNRSSSRRRPGRLPSTKEEDENDDNETKDEKDFTRDRTESTWGGSSADGMELPKSKDELVNLMRLIIQQENQESQWRDSLPANGNRNRRKAAELDLADDDDDNDVELAPLIRFDDTPPKKNPPQKEQSGRSISPYGDLDPGQLAALAGDTAELEKDPDHVFDARESIMPIERSGNSQMWHAPFPESTFTLIYMCSVKSQGFWYATFIYLLQLATIGLTIVDIIDIYTDGNPLRIPPMVDLTVTFAQTISLALALAYQSDLIEAVIKIQDGYYPEVLDRQPGATFNTWAFSCAAQLISGLLLMVASFILTMQMETVIEGMLNLTALTFMAEIDDVGFALAKMGFVRSKLQREAESVVDFMVPKRRTRNFPRRFLYALSLLSLFVGYGVIKYQQLNGYYLQTYVYVQFGDSYNRKISYYSGILSSGQVRTSGYREYRDVGTDQILLSYCPSQQAWTFSEKNDPCNFFAISERTSSYDVTSLPDSAWHVKDTYDRLQPFDTFSLVGRDCESNICQGKCVKGLCECPSNRFGMDCEFESVCSDLSVDYRFSPFPAATNLVKTGNNNGGNGGGTTTETKANGDDGGNTPLAALDDDKVFYAFLQTDKFPISDEFQILKNEAGDYVKVYNFPVYYSNETYPANVIFFAGRRWVITNEQSLFDLGAARKQDKSRTSFPDKTAAVLENQFHAYHLAKYTTFYLSDPVDFETPNFLPTPSGLKWWTVGVVNDTARYYAPDSELNTVLNCKMCFADQGEFCGVGGSCNQTTGQCECALGYKGDKCELQEPCYDMENPCWGWGVCDQSSGVCKCSDPYFGNQCEKSYKCFQEGGTCFNGGQCNSTSGLCDCPLDSSILGLACELKKDCNIFGCENGGMCGPTGECICQTPYSGGLCQEVDRSKAVFCTQNSDCLSGGTCQIETGICSCPFGKFGTLCEHTFDCSITGLAMKCQNDGTCDGKSCLCPKGYTGADCSIFDQCANNDDCQGPWSECISGVCHCEPHLDGAFCEREVHCKEQEVPCHGRGECRSQGSCHCTSHYYGSNCEYMRMSDEAAWSFDIFSKMIEACGFPPYEANSTHLPPQTLEYCIKELEFWENYEGHGLYGW